MSVARRHLLLLGSNLDHDLRLRQALAALAALGHLERPAPMLHLPPQAGHGRWYFNTLVVLECALDDAALERAVHGIEDALGRSRDGGSEVAIDIDRLAVADTDGAWRADPHAVAKGELGRRPASDLLARSGIVIAP